MIAPDLLGHADTSAPTSATAYMAKHVIEILDHENTTYSPVIAIADDWGSIFLATLTGLYLGSFSLLIFLVVGYSSSQE